MRSTWYCPRKQCETPPHLWYFVSTTTTLAPSPRCVVLASIIECCSIRMDPVCSPAGLTSRFCQHNLTQWSRNHVPRKDYHGSQSTNPPRVWWPPRRRAIRAVENSSPGQRAIMSGEWPAPTAPPLPSKAAAASDGLSLTNNFLDDTERDYRSVSRGS